MLSPPSQCWPQCPSTVSSSCCEVTAVKPQPRGGCISVLGEGSLYQPVLKMLYVCVCAAAQPCVIGPVLLPANGDSPFSFGAGEKGPSPAVAGVDVPFARAGGASSSPSCWLSHWPGHHLPPVPVEGGVSPHPSLLPPGGEGAGQVLRVIEGREGGGASPCWMRGAVGLHTP